MAELLPVPVLLLVPATELEARLLEPPATDEAPLAAELEPRDVELAAPLLLLLPLVAPLPLPLLARLLLDGRALVEDPAPELLAAAALEDVATTPEEDPPPVTARHSPSTHWLPCTQSPSPLQGCAHPSAVATVSPSQRWPHASMPGKANAASSTNHPRVGLSGNITAGR